MVKALNKYGDFSFALNICEIEANIEFSGNRVEGLKFHTAKGGINTIPEAENHSRKELLLENYPNPAVSDATIRFELPEASFTMVDIYELGGRHIMNLLNKNLHAGTHHVPWSVNHNGRRLPAGIYICTIRSADYSNSIKISVSE